MAGPAEGRRPMTSSFGSAANRPCHLDRTIGRAAAWHRDIVERRRARRLARQWQFVTDRQLRDLGLDRVAVVVPGAVFTRRFPDE